MFMQILNTTRWPADFPTTQFVWHNKRAGTSRFIVLHTHCMGNFMGTHQRCRKIETFEQRAGIVRVTNTTCSGSSRYPEISISLGNVVALNMSKL